MMKKAYHYLFYKLYKFSEAAPSRWLSDWKAELAMDGLWVFTALSGLFYYTVFTNDRLNLGNGKFLAMMGVIFICLPNYFIFHHKDPWKRIVNKFDKLPKRTNKIGGWIVFSIVILVLTNLIFSIYLTSRMAR